MAQVTIYLDDDTARRMREAARASGLSMSAWLARLVREQTRSTWPEEVSALAGSWQDAPDPQELRSVSAEDLPREPL